MCEFCKNWHNENTICGNDIDIKQYDRNIVTSLTKAQILKNKNDKKAGMIIYSHGSIPAGYFDIDYCPKCGRKLSEV